MANHPLDPVRAIAMKYPGAEKAFLFGDHEVFRVNKKVFVWLGRRSTGGYGISVKLKDSQPAALMLPFCKASGYGMAKWGWVDVEFPKGKPPPMQLVKQWLDESYRHTAPKKLLKAWEAGTLPKEEGTSGVTAGTGTAARRSRRTSRSGSVSTRSPRGRSSRRAQ
ncbi:MAG: MmcQ/YjbR family DNA-binding protein [Myxococcaceae bacterium]|nr:MmcQ/YjbR family DNA-binding protein [Myxococcaceae bacterium]